MNVRLTTRAKLLRYLSSPIFLPILSVMALTPQDIAQQAGKTAKTILGIPAGIIGDTYAGYIKDPPGEGIIPNIGVGIARQACRRYADNPGGVPGPVAAGFERVCRPYLDDIGYGEGPTLDLPFRGGQCAAVYLVTTTRTSDLAGTSTATLRVLGPVGGVRNRLTSPGNYDWEIFCSGIAFGFTGCGPVPDGGPAWRRIGGFNSSDGVVSTTLDSIEPCGPDDCGNPAPIVGQPRPPAIPGPQVEPFNPAPGIDIDIDLTIGPGGDINFSIGGPVITIDPFGGGDDGGGDDGGGAPGSGLPPGDIGSPAAPSDTGEEGVSSGCAPPNSVLVGVKVNILEPLPQVSEYDPRVRRGACYVYMGTATNLALVPEGVALRDGQMLFAPLDNLTCWEVRANVGYQLRVTPYYRALEPQEV